MTNRDEARRNYIVAALVEAGSMFERDARSYLAEHDVARRAEHLNEGADAIVAENDRKLWASKPGKHWAADLLRAMAAASSPRPAADVQPAAVEFGVRAPSGVLTPTHDRAEAEQRLARLRDMYPTAGLVQRTVRYGPWIEVPR